MVSALFKPCYPLYKDLLASEFIHRAVVFYESFSDYLEVKFSFVSKMSFYRGVNL